MPRLLAPSLVLLWPACGLAAPLPAGCEDPQRTQEQVRLPAERAEAGLPGARSAREVLSRALMLAERWTIEHFGGAGSDGGARKPGTCALPLAEQS